MVRALNSLAVVCAVLTGVVGLSANASILPPNNLADQDGFAPSNVSEEQFNAITDAIVDMWKPLAKLHGAELVAEKRWNDSTVNAYASRSGNTWTVQMFGGLARRPEITPDGFALVVCHELGHHFGGYAFKSGHWAASEGESDYFATQVCARRIWSKSKEKNQKLADSRPAHLQNACDSVWKSEDEKNLCYRTTEAGLSLARLLGALGGETMPTLETKDTTEVSSTVEYHPKAQCRLDTYLHGALCTASFDLKVIPGARGDQFTNSPESEIEAGKYSCMQNANFKVGFRPRCWFKPLNDSFSGDDDFTLATTRW